MSLTGNNILGGASGQTTGYDIDQSLRFNDDDGTYLSKAAPGAAGNLNNWTISVWLKRGQTTGLLAGSWEYQFFSQGDVSSNPVSTMSFYSSGANTDKIAIGMYGTSDSNLVCNWTSDSVYRDYSAWYHVVVKWDNTQSAAADILKVYVNGEVVSGTFTTSPSNGATTVVNKDFKQFLGKYVYGTQPNWWDGYMAEYHFIDGQSLTPASFGETNSDTNQWVPLEYAGSYGTQGWYLNFSDSSSLGADSSGNGNNFTANVLAATDQVLDSPTNNFTTFNSVCKDSNAVLSEGNLKIIGSAHLGASVGTIGASAGKWYWEMVVVTSVGGYIGTGIAKETTTDDIDSLWAGGPDSISYYADGKIYNNGSTTSTSMPTYAVGDIIGIAVDLDNYKLYFSKNNSWINSGDPTSGSTGTGSVATPASVGWLPVAHGSGSSSGYVANFGQDSSFAGTKTAQGNGGDGEDFYYTPPAGYKALNTDNLPDPSIADPTAHMNTVLYTGNGGTQSVTGAGFAPDFVWIKNRTDAVNHGLFDTVRGVKNSLQSNTTTEARTAAGATEDLYAFGSDGFSVGVDTGGTSYINCNESSKNYASWNWKAGGTASSNTDGTDITSSVSANPTAGFSVVKWTGTGATDDSVGHGLSQAPELIIVKNIEDAGNDWATWHDSFPVQSVIYLNSTGAASIGGESGRFDTLPTASVFTPGNAANTNENTKDYIAYCFHSVEGYSKVGVYEGNANADGPFVYTGFQPAFVIIKGVDQAGSSWFLMDNKRDEYNVVDKELFADSNSAEGSGSRFVDFNSNGFKLRANDALNYASTMLYYAVSESPFKTSNAR